jgi:hypothetical protein
MCVHSVWSPQSLCKYLMMGGNRTLLNKGKAWGSMSELHPSCFLFYSLWWGHFKSPLSRFQLWNASLLAWLIMLYSSTYLTTSCLLPLIHISPFPTTWEQAMLFSASVSLTFLDFIWKWNKMIFFSVRLYEMSLRIHPSGLICHKWYNCRLFLKTRNGIRMCVCHIF